MLADVDAGSDTPSLVGKVLKWRKENPEEAKALWDTIDALNTKLANVLSGLSDTEAKNPTVYRKAVKYISTIQSVQWLANPNITQNGDHAAFKEVIETFVEAHQITEASLPLLPAVLDERLHISCRTFALTCARWASYLQCQ